jgi:hypothetical protein
LYKDYGEYSNYRNFPLDLDGLKPVERRVLLSAFKIARNSFVKSRQIDAYTIGHYHPHGECVLGETKILLLSGKSIAIKELINEKSFWVYSCKQDGEIVPGLAHSVRVVKKINSYYRITLDNNKFFECTEDHPIMLRDGNYKETKDLEINESLMPLYLRLEDGYTYYKDNSKKIIGSEKVCKMVARNLINSNIDNIIGLKKYHTHHKNSIRHDDRPENIEVLSCGDHCKETVLNRDPSVNRVISKKVRKAFQENKEFRESALSGLEKGREKMFSPESPIREKIRKKNSILMNNYNKIYIKVKILKILKKMLNNNVLINEINYNEYRKELYNGPRWKTIFDKFESLDKAIEESRDYNHTIKNIEIINVKTPIEVYDMSVEKYNNFAIEGGIFAHNCYGTVVQLVNQGFLDGQGNFGSKAGVEPTGAAAPRYTECKISRKTLDLAFKYVDYVPWIDTELSDTEPQFLPTMFPICLLGKEYTQGIGFGFKSLIPCYTIQDLYKRLQLLLGIRKNKVIISPIADCEILSNNDVLENLLKTGKEKIEMAGHVSSIPSQNKAILRSWPSGKRFETILGKFDKELSDGLIGFSDLSTNETIIEFQVLRERNRDKIYKDFIDKLKEAVKGSVSFENIMVDINQRVVLRSIDQMLLRTFEMFSDVNVKMLTSEIERVQKQIDEYTLLEKIKPHLLVAITNGFTIKQAAEAIREMTKIPEETVIFLINKYKISKLLELKTDTTELAEIKKDFESKLANKNQFVLEQYDAYCK